MKFQPSSLGDLSTGYNAQSMLTTYRQGQDVGDAYGVIPGLTDIVAGGVVGLLSPVVSVAGMVHEGKQNKANREHDVTMAKQQRKTMDKQAALLAAEAELAAANNAGTAALASWIGGSVMVVGLAAVAIFAASKAKDRRRKA